MGDEWDLVEAHEFASQVGAPASRRVSTACWPYRKPRERAPECEPDLFIQATTYGSIGQLAALLKVTPEEVAELETRGRLLSVPPSSRPSRDYPLYQALPGVVGPPLEAVLELFLRARNAGEIHIANWEMASFFLIPTPFLVWLTPLEVMLGQRVYDDPLEQEAAWLLRQDAAFRIRAALAAAHDESMHRRSP